MLAQDYSLDELRGVCPEPVIFDPTSIQPVATEMLAFAERLNAPIDTKLEKRVATRHPFIATLRAMEFDKRLRPVGSPFNTLCRNLSTRGICLINGREVQSEFLVIELLTAAGGIPIQTLAHVLRQRPVGPYHDIGFEFVTKLAKPKSEML